MRTAEVTAAGLALMRFQSLVGAMRTRPLRLRGAAGLGVSIPRRGNEDGEEISLLTARVKAFQSLVGAMRTSTRYQVSLTS